MEEAEGKGVHNKMLELIKSLLPRHPKGGADEGEDITAAGGCFVNDPYGVRSSRQNDTARLRNEIFTHI